MELVSTRWSTCDLYYQNTHSVLLESFHQHQKKHHLQFSGIYVFSKLTSNRESILLGETDFTYREIEQVIDALRPSFPGSKYHPMRLNCNNFSDALAKKLLKGKSIPPWINRMAMFGNMFSCLLPRDLNDPKTVGGDIGGGKTFSAFSGSGRTLTITSIPKQKKDQEDEEPLIDRRQKMLQATLNRLNASGKSDKEL